MTKSEEYIKRITEITDLTEEGIQTLVDNKKTELKGLISEEGALFIIAKEYGIEEIKSAEKKIIDHEVIDLMKEIEEENPELKEVMEIVKTKQYKTLYNAIYKAGKQLIDYAEGKKLFSIGPGEKINAAAEKPKKEKIEFIDVAIIKDYNEKSYKLRNEKDQYCFIAKSNIEKIDGNRIHLTSKAQNFVKFEWQDEKQ